VTPGEVEMPSRTWLNRRAVLLGALGLTLAGCRGQTEFKPNAPDEQALKELAAAYRDFSRKNKRGPQTLKELGIKGQSYPNAIRLLKSGDLVVQWGSPLSADGETADAVLAYFRTVPAEGGSVLMQDGNTIKTMTADEFKAAPKAGFR
jgi:hypothetical protein